MFDSWMDSCSSSLYPAIIPHHLDIDAYLQIHPWFTCMLMEYGCLLVVDANVVHPIIPLDEVEIICMRER